MKALVYAGAGGASVIRLEDVPEPDLKPGQLRVAVKASGVNRADLSQREGRYPPPPGESEIPGLEAAGVVLETAPGAFRFKKGDRVMALLGGGGYAEQVCVDERLALPLPGKLGFEQGVGVMETFVTAHDNLFFLGGAPKGGAALVHAGASGVGTSALQLLRRAGVKAFATAGTDEKAALCRELGATAILRRKERVSEIVLAGTGGRGVDVVLDPVGGPALEEDFRCLAVGGRLVLIGLMGGREAVVDLGRLLAKRHRLLGSTLRALPLEEKAAAVARMAHDALAALESGELAPVMDQVFPAAEAARAQERMQADLNLGKLALRW